jgi:hypothetical protein
MHGEHGIPEVDHSEFSPLLVIVASVVSSGNEFKTLLSVLVMMGQIGN